MTDPLTWVSCFLAFMASQTSHEETRDMAAYAMIIIRLSRKHSGSGWLLYDKQFRQHVTAGSTLPWADINASLMAATVLSHAGDRPCQSCSLCLGGIILIPKRSVLWPPWNYPSHPQWVLHPAGRGSRQLAKLRTKRTPSMIITPATGSTMDTVAALRASSSTLALTASRLGTRPRCARSRRGRPRGSQIRRGLPCHLQDPQCLLDS